MSIIKFTIILFSAHFIGSAILFGYVSGPDFILAAPVLSIFGWFFLFPEAFGILLLWRFYKPYSRQSRLSPVKYALISGLIGALFAASFIPKEENNEISFWIGGALAGYGATIFAFIYIHQIKLSNRNWER